MVYFNESRDCALPVYPYIHIKTRSYVKREGGNVHFFCSRKLNGKSGFAVNGDGLLYSRAPCPLKADLQNTNGGR